MIEINLYRKPVYVVYYGSANKFELKTLNGCMKKIEKLGIKKYQLYKFTQHVTNYDNHMELIKEVK